MSNTINGGPAFPGTQYARGISPSGHSAGMTLRDYFAAKAMQEMKWHDEDHAAQACYEIADAMLRARESK